MSGEQGDSEGLSNAPVMLFDVTFGTLSPNRIGPHARRYLTPRGGNAADRRRHRRAVDHATEERTFHDVTWSVTGCGPDSMNLTGLVFGEVTP